MNRSAHDPPRILLLSPRPNSFGIMTFYERAFLRLGVPARQVYEDPLPHRMGGRVYAAACARSRVVSDTLIRRSQRILSNEIATFRPNLLFIGKGDRLQAEFVRQMREEYRLVVVNLYTDSPLAAVRHVSNFFALLPDFDCVVTFARALVPVLYQYGAKRVERVAFAYDPDTHRPLALEGGDATLYSSPVGYLGQWGPLVERWLLPVARFGLKLWGVGWRHLSRKSALYSAWQKPGREGHGMGGAMAKVCAGSRTVFNLVRAEHGCAHSMKTFEIPACRGFLLTNRTEEQLEVLEEDRHAVYYSTAEELVDKLGFYLSRDQERDRIASAAWERIKPETYTARAQEILRLYGELRRG